MNNDEEYWKKLKQGDPVALGAIYERYAELLYAYGMKIAHDSELINDCIQDLFVYLYEKRERLSVPVNIKAYLLTSMKRKIYQAREDAVKDSSRLVRIDNTNVEGQKLFNMVIDVPATMERKEFQEEQLTTLQEALNGLSPQQREILYLRYYKRLSLDEVSLVIGTGKQVIKNVTCRALARLRQNELLSKAFLLELVVFYEGLM